MVEDLVDVRVVGRRDVAARGCDAQRGGELARASAARRYMSGRSRPTRERPSAMLSAMLSDARTISSASDLRRDAPSR